MSYRIASFNIQKFTYPGSRDHNIPKRVAKLIIDNRIDILSIQEIFNKQAAQEIVRNLNYGLSKPWDFRWLPSGKDGEGYACIWNNKCVNLIEKKLDGRVLENPIIRRDYSFVRPPFYIRFTPSNKNLDYEIRIINTHIRFSKHTKIGNQDDSESENDSDKIVPEGMVALRRAEFDELIKMYNKIAIPEGGIDSQKVVYTILLGDYNLCLKSSGVGPFLNSLDKNRENISIQSNSYNYAKTIKTFQSKKTSFRTVPSDVKSLIESNQIVPEELERQIKLSHNYDHFTFDIDMFGEPTKEPVPINPIGTENPTWKQVYDYRKEYSDHLPIVFDFDINHHKVTQVIALGEYKNVQN